MKFLITLVLAISTLSLYAQKYGRFQEETSALMTDALGQPFYPQQKYNWEGKVFFPDNYAYATITASNGRTYRNIKAKLNLLEYTLLFTDSAGKEFVASVLIDKVEFEDPLTLSKKTFIRPGSDTGKALYMVLDSGKASLLKKIFITYKDQSNYGSTTVTRVFEQKHAYFVYKDAVLTSLDKSKSALLDILADKRSAVEIFIDNEKLKIRKEEDMVKLFRYYNSL